jgi:CheY-like chemotaxis protein
VLTPTRKNRQSTVLVVDDDEYSRELARLTLSQLGYDNVHVAQDGNEGLRVLDTLQPPPDFLICDIFMPDIDGIEFVAGLVRRDYRGGLILVTGGDVQMLSVARLIAVQSGLNVLAALTKPLQQDALQQVVPMTGSESTI